MIMQAVGDTGGAWLLVQDDPDLIPMTRARGFRVVYRQSGDDPEHNPLPASNKSKDIKAAAEAFTVERGKKGADAINLTNELQSSPKLHEFTRYCLEKSFAEGWTALAYSYATHTRLREYLDARDNLVYAVTHGQGVGVHMYPDYLHDATVAEWIGLRHDIGGLWLAAEFNWTLSYTDPYHGWRNIPKAVLDMLGYATAEAFRVGFIAKWSAWLALHNIPACWFAVDYWNQPTLEDAKRAGYGWGDLEDVTTALTSANWVYKYKEPIMSVPAPTTGGVRAALTQIPQDFVNIREQPDGADLGDLHVGDQGTYFAPTPASAGWAYFEADKGVSGWVSLQGGKVVFQPILLPPGDETYPVTGIQIAELQALAVDARKLADRIDTLVAEVVQPGADATFPA